MPESIRVMLVDDHRLVREGLRALLQDIPRLQIVTEANSGRAALDLLETHQPDIVVMDIGMPDLNGLEATKCIANDFPNTRVIILSRHAEEEYVVEALRAGAVGYILKDATVQDLETGIRAVFHGDTYLSPSISQHVVTDYLRRLDVSGCPNDVLTERQREVLRLIAEGCSTKAIAKALSISVKTAERHRSQLMDRLNIHEVAGLVRYAIRMGLTSAEL